MWFPEFLASVYESVLFVWFLDFFCGSRYTGWKRGAFGGLAGMALSIHILLMDAWAGEPEALSLWIDAFLLAVYWKYCLNSSFLHFLAAFGIYYLGIGISVIAPVIGMELCLGEGVPALLGENQKARVIFLLLDKGLLSLYVCIIWYIQTIFFFPKQKMSYFIYGILPFFTLLCCFIITKEAYGRELPETMRFPLLLMVGVCVMLLAGLFCLAVWSFQKEKALSEVRQREQLYQNERKLTEQLYETVRELGAVRHEMVNRLLAISYLLEEEQIEEASQQVQKGIKEWGGAEDYEKKEELWARVAAQKLARYPEYADCVRIKVELGDYSGIDPVEFCMLFGNLLENALEAQRGTDIHWIQVEMRERFGCLYVKVENSCAKTKESKRREGAIEELATTKEDVLGHRYGLKHIQKIVGQHQGMLEIEQKNGIFRVKVLLELPNLT